MRKNAVKNLALNALLSVTSIVVFAVVVELLLQVATPFVKPRFTKVDPHVGWYHYPGVSDDMTTEGHDYHLSYNSHGYRVPEHSFEKPDTVRRIILIGDSFVDGSEVGDQEVFSWHLQEQLPCVEVINLGVYGYSTAQELVTLERVGLRYDPDLVLVFTITRDFEDNLKNYNEFGPIPRFLPDGDSLRFEGTDHPSAREVFRAVTLPVPGRTFLFRHSHLYYLLNRRIYQRFKYDRMRAIRHEQAAALSLESQRDLYRRLIVRMKGLSEVSGAEFLPVFIYLRDELVEGRGSPNGELVTDLAASGVAALDLYEDLRDAHHNAPSPLYFAEDIHWNPDGHKAVAGLLARHLDSWLQSDPSRACDESSLRDGRRPQEVAR